MLEECDRPAGRWPVLRQEREGRTSRISCRGPSDGSGSGRGVDGKAQCTRALPYLQPLTSRGTDHLRTDTKMICFPSQKARMAPGPSFRHGWRRAHKGGGVGGLSVHHPATGPGL